MERKELETLTVNELIEKYATPLQIPRRHKMKKADLIDAILERNEKENVNSSNLVSSEAKEKEKEEVKAEVVNKKEQEELSEIQKQNKMRYVENADIGTILAFKLPGIKVKSAKITRKSTKNRKFKVETAYGTEYVISFDDVLWVKTNKRWPKGVYNLLKGVKKDA